ncbi:pentatricopeptide repeat-containing protein-like, mitochondrial [Iris pallida]|uniref:Pentatricopeptide repeat-containing protein-like, mitochondrial n=1 Tax=Iris pallida TaxID=29817 RepID=A0AAX6HEC6_IRIPA|nr:pentatricopeptide repeat-containing protein-like, mitochondrial [Iris pallida]
MAFSAALRRQTPKLPLLLLPPRSTSSFSTQSLRDPESKPKPEPLGRTFSLLRSSIRSEPDPDRICTLFQSSTHLPRFYHGIPLHQLAVARLAQLRRPDLVGRILESLKSDPLAPKSEGFLIRIISLYSSAGMLDHAVKTFDEMPTRTERSFSALLSAYYHNGRTDLLNEKFLSLPKKLGIAPGVWSYSIYLKSLCKTGEIANAVELLDEMSKSELTVPNIVSYNTVLDGCVKHGDEVNFEKIFKIVSDRKLEVNVVTYNYRLAMFCRRSESFKAEELLAVMAAREVEPNLASFNTVIQGFCREGDVGSAVRVFRMMKGKEEVVPNSKTYVALIRSLVEKGEYAVGLEICKECFARKFAPPFETVKGLIGGLVKDDRSEEAKEIVAKMKGAVRGDAAEAWKKFEAELAL